MEISFYETPPHLLQVLQLVIFLCYSLWKHAKQTLAMTLFLCCKNIAHCCLLVTLMIVAFLCISVYLMCT